MAIAKLFASHTNGKIKPPPPQKKKSFMEIRLIKTFWNHTMYAKTQHKLICKVNSTCTAWLRRRTQ